MKETDKFERENLLIEYEVLSSRVAHLTNITWQTASLFIGVAITGLAVVGGLSFDATSRVPSLGVLMLGLAVTFVISLWNDTANRWNATISIFYSRLNELEEKLGLFGNRYITVLDRLHKERKKRTGQLDDPDLQNEFVAIAEKHLSTHSRDSIANFRNLLVIGISFGWLCLIILNAIIEACYCLQASISSSAQLIKYLPELTTDVTQQGIIAVGVVGFVVAVERLHKPSRVAIVLVAILVLSAFALLIKSPWIVSPSLQSIPWPTLLTFVGLCFFLYHLCFGGNLPFRNSSK